jgi:translation initiation factor 1
MNGNDWKKRLGTVYSTDASFQYTQTQTETVKTPEPEKQRLTVSLDKRNRGGKKVTLVSGFSGKKEDLDVLGRTLKVKCGVGGTVKEGEITIQGDFRDKVTAILQEMGYKTKRGN